MKSEGRMNETKRHYNTRDAVAIITGATSGLGRATAFALAHHGSRIIATGRRVERLAQIQNEIEAIGGECHTIAGDAADPENARVAVTEALSHYGRVDILVNNAGRGIYKPLAETTLEDFEGLIASNLKSSFLFTRAVAPHFVKQKHGVLIFVSSVAGLRGAPNEAVYSATKFEQIGFAQSVDEELRPHGICVCTIYPGGMKTEFALGNGRNAEDVARSAMDPSSVADAILYVCNQPAGVRIPELVIRHMGKLQS